MILEDATVTVKPGSEDAFVEAVKRGRSLVTGTPGFVSLELRRGIERTNVFKLLIRWETLEAHTIDFRRSDRFTGWRGHIGEFFAEPPFVEHFFEPVVTA